MNDTALVKAEAGIIVDHEPESIIRYALERGAAVDVIERMMAVRRELKEEAGKAAFDAALRDFQAECPIIVKAKSVPDSSGKVAYSYAPLEDIIGQVRALLQKHGFSFTLDTDIESKDGWVIAKCNVTHCAGHCRVAGTRRVGNLDVFNPPADRHAHRDRHAAGNRGHR